MSDIEELTQKIINFRNARDWQQFHNPKDLALSLVLESSEVLEHFQWKNPEEISRHIEEARNEIGEELADVLYWVLLMSHDMNIDIAKALQDKLNKNESRYPVDKAKGRHTKYNRL